MSAEARTLAESLGLGEALSLYPPVPPHVARVAGHERRQMLVESHSRAALQRLLAPVAARRRVAGVTKDPVAQVA